MKQVTLAAFLLMALALGTVRLPVTACTVTNTPIGQSCVRGCCGSNGCCADSQKGRDLPTVPLVKESGATSALSVALASSPVIAILPTQPAEMPLGSLPIHASSSVPRVVLLCTFLI